MHYFHYLYISIRADYTHYTYISDVCHIGLFSLPCTNKDKNIEKFPFVASLSLDEKFSSIFFSKVGKIFQTFLTNNTRRIASFLDYIR